MTDAEKWNRDNQAERQVLFGNEGFALGVFQTVSGLVAFGIVNQYGDLQTAAGKLPIMLALTGVVAALICAVLGAWYRHSYKMWDLKARSFAANGLEAETAVRQNRAGRRLVIMRRLMNSSAILISVSLASIVVGIWAEYLWPGVMSGQ